MIFGKQHRESNCQLPVHPLSSSPNRILLLYHTKYDVRYFTSTAQHQHGSSARKQMWLSNLSDLDPVDDSI